MRSQTGIGLLFVSIVPLALSGCGRVAQPLECSSGGDFARPREQQSTRASSSAPLVLTGTLVGPDGKTLMGQQVLLDKKPTAQDWAALFFAAPLVLADCWTTKRNALCENTHASQTDERSGFRFEVDDEPVEGEHGFEIYSALPPHGARVLGAQVSRAVYPRGQHLETGELRFWDPELEPVRLKDRLLVTATDDRCRGDEAVELVSETGEAWFRVHGGQADDALFDDAPTGVRLVANVGSTRYASGVVRLAPESAPASRSAVCTVRRANGTTDVESPCLLTDGRGDRALGADVVSVEIAVPAAQSTRVAVRGYGALSATLDVSGDGTSWFTAAERLTGSQVVRAPGVAAPPVRFVRLTPAGGSNHLGRVFEVLVR